MCNMLINSMLRYEQRVSANKIPFLVAYEAAGHSQHTASRALFSQRLSIGDDFALAPQVLAEFVHVLTDQTRIAQPLTMDAALR
jgi:predicted nucleic acid-binding protein